MTEWTLFKDRIPFDHHAYVTDWTSVWVMSLENGETWVDYANNNPEYAWAKPPRLDVPKKPETLKKRCSICNRIME